MTHRIFTTSVASVYKLYIAKVERKGRSAADVEAVTCWLTGHSPESLAACLARGTDFATFLAEAPALNPMRELVTGTVCGVRVEAVEDPTMRFIRQLDKLVDELAKGRPLEKVLRGG